MIEVVFYVEKMQYYLDWYNVYNIVDFVLSIYDVGNKVIDKDWDLAKAIDEVFECFKQFGWKNDGIKNIVVLNYNDFFLFEFLFYWGLVVLQF